MFEPEASTAAAKTDPAEETNGRAAPASEDQGATAEASTGNKEHGGGGGDEDELAFHTFELIDALQVYKQGEKTNVEHGSIPKESFLKLLQLLHDQANRPAIRDQKM